MPQLKLCSSGRQLIKAVRHLDL